jgi:RNA polymerase sigma factor (sigma-70 family)
MLNSRQKAVLPQLCRLIGAPFGGELTDRELLGRFLGRRDAAAFAALVRRHGPTVLGVCRRVLNNAHDAEDAFQATFLILARKARSIARHEALGSWLYGVAYRTALKARADAARRRKHEGRAADRAGERSRDDEARDDLRPIIDEEVNRLPDKYRRPIVLCYFEGKTYQEAARLLGCPAGTASVRLARARALLRSRLALRGLALAAGTLAAWTAEVSALAAEVGLFAEATAGVAARFAADPAAAGVSARVIALTEGVVKEMLLRKWKTVAGVFLAVGITCGGAGALRHFATPAPAAEQPAEAPRADPAPPGGGPLGADDRPSTAEESPAGPPPRAIAPPAGEAARPLHTRIGLFNLNRVLKGSKKYQSIQTDVRTRIEEAQKKVEALRTQVKNYQAEHDARSTTVGRRDECADHIRRLKREIEDEEIRAKAEVNKLSGRATVRLYREVEEAANRVAKVKGLELVLFYTDAVTEADFYNPNVLERKLSQPGALMPMVAAPGMDITDSVLEALNRAHAADPPPR